MEPEDSYIYALNGLVNFIAEKHGFDENVSSLHDAIVLLIKYQKRYPHNILISGDLKDYILSRINETSL